MSISSGNAPSLFSADRVSSKKRKTLYVGGVGGIQSFCQMNSKDAIQLPNQNFFSLKASSNQSSKSRA